METKVNDFGTLTINFSAEETKKVEELKKKVKELDDNEIPPIAFFFAKFIDQQPAINCAGEKEHYLFADSKISAKLTVASLTEMPNRYQLLAGVYFAEAIDHGATDYESYFELLSALKKADKKRLFLNSTAFNIKWGLVEVAKAQFSKNFDYEYRWREFLSTSFSKFNENLLQRISIHKKDWITQDEIGDFLYKFYRPMITGNNIVTSLTEKDLSVALNIFGQNNIKFKKIEKSDNGYIMIL